MSLGSGEPSEGAHQRWDAMVFTSHTEAEESARRYCVMTGFESQGVLLSVCEDRAVKVVSLWGPMIDLDPDTLTMFPDKPLSFRVAMCSMVRFALEQMSKEKS